MVERTLPKPDTRVRFPSAAPKAPDFVAGLFPRLKRESLPGGNTFPRALGISAFQPVSRSTSPGPYGLGLYFLAGRGGMFLTPAGNPSSLRFGHPDVATEHTDFSPSPGRWSSGCGCAVWNEPRALGLGRVCGNGEGEYWGEVPQTARRETKVGSRVWWWFRRDVSAPSEGSSRQGLL